MKFKKFLSLILSLVFVAGLASCTPKEPEYVDYTEITKLDMSNNSYAKLEVDLKLCIDGDTTHFNVDTSIDPTGIMKIRYLGIDTPESTGKIEPWGKAASDFNKERIEAATSIIIESDSDKFELDSTGGRYLAFVWYKLPGATDYRCLNIELMQEGFCKAYSGGKTHYAEQFDGAWKQAQRLKLRQYGEEKDPGYDYGENRPNITLKELRIHIDDYVDKAIRTEGIVTKVFGNNVIIQDYDGEDNRYYAIEIFCGYSLSALGWEMLVPGNRVSMAGTLTYKEAFGYTLNDITYLATRPNYDKNMRLVSEGNEVVAIPVDGTIMNDASEAKLLQQVLVKAENLVVEHINVTESATDSNGAMSIHVADAKGNKFVVRTSAMYEKDGKTLITPDRYEGETISVIGTIEEYSGSYQIHVYTADDIEF